MVLEASHPNAALEIRSPHRDLDFLKGASPPKIALFDLDNTLLRGDSDYLWGCFLVEEGLVDGEAYLEANARFYRDYQEGRLDIEAFLRFALRPLAEHPPEKLFKLRERFIAEKIEPIVLPAARWLVESHRERGDRLVIVTATNAFITRPIAELFGIEELIATEPEFKEGRYTGNFVGTPAFREGKVARLIEWRARKGLEEIPIGWAYSDSQNDLPLLELAETAVAVDPDEALRREAQRRGWPQISLRKGDLPILLGEG